MLISAPSLLLLWWQDGAEGASSLVCSAVAWHGDEGSDVMVPGALYSEPGSGRMEGARRREKMKWGKGSRQRGREHGDSVITFTLPDTAVRLMLDSYPQPSLHPPLLISHTVYLRFPFYSA